jgi:hypothetical protein
VHAYTLCMLPRKRSTREHKTSIDDAGSDGVDRVAPTQDLSVKRPKSASSVFDVGMPYQGKPVGAFWLLLGASSVSLRRSDYDLDRTVRQIRATGYPDAEDMVEILLEQPDPERVADFFEQRAAGDRHGLPSTP